MVLAVLRRLVGGVLVVVVVAVFAYGGWRALRPELFGGQPLVPSTWGDLRALAHLDLASEELPRRLEVDLWLVGGALLAGMTIGLWAGTFCAAHPRTLRTRAIETAAMAFYCLPPWVFAFGLLLLFEPTFGAVHLPWFFDVNAYQPPYDDPWAWFRTLLVPWLVVGLPIAAAVMRITRATTWDALQEDHMRTAAAKGLSREQVVRRHGRPHAYATVASYMGTAAAHVVLNVTITESVLAVPGYLQRMRRALGERDGVFTGVLNVPRLQLLAVWIAILVVLIGFAADLALAAADPRTRSAGRSGR